MACVGAAGEGLPNHMVAPTNLMPSCCQTHGSTPPTKFAYALSRSHTSRTFSCAFCRALLWDTRSMNASREPLRPATLLGIAALVVLASIGTYLLVRPSAESQIRSALVHTLEAVSAKTGDTPISRLARIRGVFADTMTEFVHVHVAELRVDVTGRTKLADAAVQAGLAYQDAHVDLLRCDVTIDPAKQNAQVEATVIVRGQRGGSEQLEQRDLHAVFRHEEGWRISSIEVSAKSP